MYINKDLTKLQIKQKYDYELRNELRRRRAIDFEEKGFTNLLIHKGRITENQVTVITARGRRVRFKNVR